MKVKYILIGLGIVIVAVILFFAFHRVGNTGENNGSSQFPGLSGSDSVTTACKDRAIACINKENNKSDMIALGWSHEFLGIKRYDNLGQAEEDYADFQAAHGTNSDATIQAAFASYNVEYTAPIALVKTVLTTESGGKINYMFPCTESGQIIDYRRICS